MHTYKKGTSRYFLIAFAVVIAVALLAQSFPAGVLAADSDAETRKQIQALENKLNKLEKEEKDLKNKAYVAKSSVSKLTAEIEKIDTQTTNISDQLTTIDALIAEWERQKQEKEADIAYLEQKQMEQKEKFERMLRMSYESGSDSYLDLIFGAEDFGDFLSRLDLISYHLDYNDTILQNLQANYEKLNKSRADYDESSEQLMLYYESQKTLKQNLDAQMAYAKEQKQLNLQDAAAAEEALKEKQRLVAELDNEIAELAKQLAKTDTSTYSGEFLWPLPSEYTTISSGFVHRINPITKKAENHNGVDIPAPARTNIYAADDGTVVIAKWNGGFGNCVTINHGGGIMTLYGHCTSLNVTSGQEVKRGDVVAFVGSTGQSTGNHLHFTVYKDGVAVNPMPYLQ